MPRDTVNRTYFLEVCQERDDARDRLRQVERDRDRLLAAIRNHQIVTELGVPLPADRTLWGHLDGQQLTIEQLGALLPAGHRIYTVKPAIEHRP